MTFPSLRTNRNFNNPLPRANRAWAGEGLT